MVRSLQQAFDDLVRFADSLGSEYVAPGVTGREYAQYIRGHRALVLPIFAKVSGFTEAIGGGVERPPEGEDYERWSEQKRRLANLNALRSLRQMQSQGRAIPTPEERIALTAFTGWGGIRVSDLPEDPVLFPAEYVEAIRQFKRTREALAGEGELTIPTTNLFAGLQHQFFTPLPVCRAMWGLARRLSPVTAVSALEPSAGVGRFIQAVPCSEGIAWTAVENDPLLVQILRALHPSVQVYATEFERVYAESQDPRFDLILSNPPYEKKRPSAHRKIDPSGSRWDRADVYFTERCMRILRPGGVLVTITPLSQIVGQSEEHVDLRGEMLKLGLFLGAVVPPSDLFKTVRLNFAIHTWLRAPEEAIDRAYETGDLDREDRGAIIAGRYLETEDGKKNVLGDWKKGRYGELEVHGIFNPASVVNMIPRRVPPSIVEEIKAWRDRAADQIRRQDNGAPRSSCRIPQPPEDQKFDPPGDARTPSEVDVDVRLAVFRLNDATSGVIEQAKALALRIRNFQARIATAPEEAEAGREELRRDVISFTEIHGNPHGIVALRGWHAHVAPLLAAVDARGRLASLLTKPAAARVVHAVGLAADAPFEEIVRWYSARYGVCTETDLMRHDVYEGALERATASESVAVELLVDGTIRYYSMDLTGKADPSRDVYATGDLYERLDRVTTLLAGEHPPALMRRLDQQKQHLIQVIDPKTLAEIDVTPRSGFVVFSMDERPYALLSDFVNAMIAEDVRGAATHVALYQEDGLYRAEVLGDLLPTAATIVENLLGYVNRQLQVTDVEEKQAKRRGRFETDDLEARMKEDAALEQRFAAWLAGSATWRDRVEDQYNRQYRGFRNRSYDSSMLQIARVDPIWLRKLHPHQNEGVRRIADRGSAIVAHDVGLGKTALALASSAMLRQEGHARRPIFLVPNSVLPKWYEDARSILPDYRTGIIGLSPREDGRLIEDGKDARHVKWHRFAQGDYDLLIAPYSNFLDDVAMMDESILAILAEQMWLQRDVGLDKAERRLIDRRIAAAEKEIAENQEVLAKGEIEVGRYRVRALTEEEREKIERKIEELQIKIKKWQEKLKAPSDTAIEQIRSDLEELTGNKPFRPRREPIKDWSSSMSISALLAFALSKGLDLEYDPADLRADGKPKKRSKRSIVEILEARFPVEGDVDQEPVPPLIYWEELECDLLVIDEAHNFKNLWSHERRYGEPSIEFMGSPSGHTIRTWDAFLKCQHLLRRHGDQGVVLLTATPMKNSPLEVYNLLSLVSSRIWREHNISSVNDFVDRFCKIEVRLSVSTTGEIRKPLAVPAFKNLDELRGLMAASVDRKTLADAPWLEAVVPDVENAGRTQIPVDMDPIQATLYVRIKEVVKEAAEAMEEELKTATSKEEINAIKAAQAGLLLRQMDMMSKVALDPRLLKGDIVETEAALAAEQAIQAQWEAWTAGGRRGARPKRPLTDKRFASLKKRVEILQALDIVNTVKPYEDGRITPPKYTALVENILDNVICGHIIFSDLNETHRWITDAILAHTSISRERIALITGDISARQRQEIARAFNGSPASIDPITGAILVEARPPEFDVVIGNTAAMGEGLDLQRRTCAVHHMTLPWEPASLQQRNGRGVRQGNLNENISIWYYIANKSFDGFKLNMILGKAGWQETMWDDAITEMNNPAVGQTLSREEMMIILFAEDEEAAYAELAVLRAEAEVLIQAQRVVEARRKLQDLITKYAKARNHLAQHPDDTAMYQALMSAADRQAALLRLIPGEPVPQLEHVLTEARARTIYYDANSGFLIGEGERVCLRSDDPADAVFYTDPQRVEITSIGVYGGTLMYRTYGSIDLAPAMHPQDLLGARAARLSGRIVQIPLESCGGWDTVKEDGEILASDFPYKAIRNMGRTLWIRFGDRLWPAMIAGAQRHADRYWTAESLQRIVDKPSGYTILEAKDDSGRIVLLSYEAAVMIVHGRNTANWDLLLTHRLVLPMEGWGKVSEALRRDRIYVISAPSGYGSLARVVPFPDDPEAIRQLDLAAGSWFGAMGVAAGALAEMRKRRSHKQELAKGAP